MSNELKTALDQIANLPMNAQTETQAETPLTTALSKGLEELIATVNEFYNKPTGENRTKIQLVKARLVQSTLYPEIASDKELAKLKARYNNPNLSFTRVHIGELFAEAYRLEREASLQRRLNDSLSEKLKKLEGENARLSAPTVPR